jgi:hypothetical protein
MPKGIRVDSEVVFPVPESPNRITFGPYPWISKWSIGKAVGGGGPDITGCGAFMLQTPYVE